MSREDVFDKLETLVLDEDGLVTYKLLSREFKIHVNVARTYLSDFLTIQKTKENVHLQATYFLAGLQEKDGIKSVKVFVVSEESLENSKSKLTEVTSCHIYSVSKVKPDEVVLYNADLSNNRNSQESKDLLVIKHPNIEIKAPTLSKSNQVKKDVKPPAKPQQNIVAVKNASANVETNGKNKTPSDKAEKAKEIKIQKPEKTSPVKTKKPNAETQKPNTLASMWQKNEEKSKVAKTDGKGKTKSPQETKKAVPKNNIMSMFSKQAEKNAVNPPKKAPVSNPVPEKKVEVATTSKSEKPPAKSSDKKRKLPQKKTKSSGKQGSDSESDGKPAKKKHRRITVLDSSDSDSEVEDIEAEDKAQRSLFLPEDPLAAEPDIVQPSPETDEDPIPPTPPVVAQKGKGRKKVSKTVKKTFMDEDGFMVTTEEKEIVSESGSDEEPIPTKSSSKDSKEATKPSNFSYRKQASLTNFFKKS